ncbi:unnamed protein product [Echinostoma caproni]|uniref:Uncharacterized protein n=1 Tax=Echinostoma caproni TaxID=27848 RepID=A0A183AQ95_9TREM|nr:unnamed protein product [Echinostoma caproni]
MSPTLQDQSAEWSDLSPNNLDQSPLTRPGTTSKPEDADTDNNNRDGSGGDGTRTTMVSSSNTTIAVLPAPRAQRRRTRSSEQTVVRSSSSIPRGRPVYRSERYQRRGHSVSGLDRLPVPSSTAPIVFVAETLAVGAESTLPSATNTTTATVATSTFSDAAAESATSRPFQVDGDSGQISPSSIALLDARKAIPSKSNYDKAHKSSKPQLIKSLGNKREK